MNDNKEIGAQINNTTPLVQEKAGEHPTEEQPIEPKKCLKKSHKKCSTFSPLMLIILIGLGIGIGVYLTPTDSKGKYLHMHI